MANDPTGHADGGGTGHARAADRVRAARARDARRLAGTIGDLFLADNARLTDATRAAATMLIDKLVGRVAHMVCRHAARSLQDRGMAEPAELIAALESRVVPRLWDGGLLRDPELIGEVLARLRQAELGRMLPRVVETNGELSLTIRLSAAPEPDVAAAARALLTAVEERREAEAGGYQVHSDLPAELHHRVAWWTGAALIDLLDDVAIAGDLDPVVSGAVERALGDDDEGLSVEQRGDRLADAIDARPDELPLLVAEALGDGQVAFAGAMIARAAGLPSAAVRAMLIDPEGDRLWLSLRAAGFDRAAIARIGVLLSDADPARDIEALAAHIDEVDGLDAAAARRALAPLARAADLSAALAALQGGGMPCSIG